MTSKATRLSICLIAGIAMFSNCKKSSTSTKGMLVGKWKVSQVAIDMNNNGQLDANELSNDTTNTTATFNDNGSGTISSILYGSTISYPFTWTLINSNQYLQVTENLGGSTTIASNHIDNLTSSSMTLKDTTGGTANWTILNKQ